METIHQEYLNKAWKNELVVLELKIAPIPDRGERFQSGEEEWIKKVKETNYEDEKEIERLFYEAPTTRAKEVLSKIVNEIQDKAELLHSNPTLENLKVDTDKVEFIKGEPLVVRIYINSKKIEMEDKFMLNSKQFQLLYYRTFLKLIKFKRGEWEEYFRFIHEEPDLERNTYDADSNSLNEIEREVCNFFANAIFVDNIDETLNGIRFVYYDKESETIFIPNKTIEQIAEKFGKTPEAFRSQVLRLLKGNSTVIRIGKLRKRFWKFNPVACEVDVLKIFSLNDEEVENTNVKNKS